MHAVRPSMFAFGATVALTLLVALGSGGCASSAPAGRSHNGSYVREGETVSLRLITWEQWKDPSLYMRPTYLNENKQRVSVELPPELVPLGSAVAKDTLRNFGLGELAGAIVGAAVDFVKVQIEKEAAKHTQQFKQFTYADDFWKGPGMANYAAFEVIRYADGYDTPERPAFRMVCAIVPSRYDRRIVLLRPVYLKVNAAAAKVSPGWSGRRRFSIEAQTIVQGASIDDKGGFEQKDLADATLSVPGYDLGESAELYSTFVDKAWRGPLSDSVAGYFRAPMPPVTKETQRAMADAIQRVREEELKLAGLDPNDQAAVNNAKSALATEMRKLEKVGADDSPWYTSHRGGAFRLYVAVTETDDSRAKKTLLEFAEFVGSQRENAVNLVKEQVEGP